MTLPDFGLNGWHHFGHRAKFLLSEKPERHDNEYDRRQAAWLHGFVCGLYFRVQEQRYDATVEKSKKHPEIMEVLRELRPSIARMILPPRKVGEVE